MKKLQLLAIAILFALAGTNTAEAKKRRSSMARINPAVLKRIQEKETKTGQTSEPNDSEGKTTTNVKLPSVPSAKKLMKQVTGSSKIKVANIKPSAVKNVQQVAEANVKLPSSIPSAEKLVRQAQNTVAQSGVSSNQIANIKKGLQKKAKIIVEMLQNSSKQNQVILEMVQDLAS